MSQDYEQAFSGFLDIIRQDRNYNDGAARKAMLTLFDVLGKNDARVQRYQRQLAMTLY